MTDIERTEFQRINDRWTDDALNLKPSEVPDMLYHYTDAAGLLGMLKTNKLWMTDYKFLNDRTEIAHTKAIARQIVNDRIANNNKELLGKLYAEILEYQSIDPPGHAFVYSLTSEADDLSQWRGYAKDGRGFTVGFCGTTLSAILGKDSLFSLCKIEYKIENQKDIINKCLIEFEKYFLESVKNERDDVDDLVNMAACNFDEVVETRAALNKHSSFSEEHEWRVVTFFHGYDNLDVNVRVSGDKLVRYGETNFGSTDKLPIKRIGIGPGFAETEEILAVEQLCKLSGYQVDIYFADTPYRRP